MSIFFENKGPVEINKIVKEAPFSQNLKLKKKFVSNISNLKDGKKNEISFFDNKKYINDLNNSKVTFCFIKKKDLVFLNNKKVTPIISEDPLLDFILTVKLFYPDADHDNIENANFSINAEYIKFNTFVHKTVKLGKNFKVGMNTTIKKNVTIGKNVSIGSNCVISNSVIDDNVIINDGTIIGKLVMDLNILIKTFILFHTLDV
jgi:UDP-3-O-[3-hydroxymyristoyl] glucosamine N-acyltransferase